MSERRELAIIGLLLGLIGGALVLSSVLDLGRANLTIEFVLSRLVSVIVGIAILFGSVLIYRRSYSTGGILNIILGILVIVLSLGTIAGVLTLISGVVGLLATEARR